MCINPNIIWPDGKHPSGKPKYRIMPLSMTASFNPREQLDLNPNQMLVPCGKCYACRLDKARQWADRCMLELETSKTAVFLTLTYNDKKIPVVTDDMDVPIWYNLSVKDWQDYMKRLRRHFEPKRLRFFMCGEYGSTTLRPHYHAIVFGLSLDDFADLVVYDRNMDGDIYYMSAEHDNIWENGQSIIAEVSFKSMAYVARYTQKKIFDSTPFFVEAGIKKEFVLMSRRPGIGAEYLAEHPDCLDYTKICVSTEDGGKEISLPKYYLKKFEEAAEAAAENGDLTLKDRYDKMVSLRRNISGSRNVLIAEGSDKEFSELLYDQGLILQKKTTSLQRNLK